METTLQDYNGRENIGQGVRWDMAGQPQVKDGPVLPNHFTARADFETLAEAQAFAAQFAKYIKVKATSLGTYDVVQGQYTTYSIATAGLDVRLYPDAVTGAVNETGLKRIRSFMLACQQLGYKVTRVRNWANSIDFDPIAGK